MRPLVTPAEMAAADQAAIASGTPVDILMDRAGRAVARAAIGMLGGRYGKKVVVVCGKGNNGGDGYAAARVLAREGVGVRCLAAVDPSELKGAAREHHERALKAGVVVRRFEPERFGAADLVIDAIFGTGFKGGAEGDTARAIEAIGRSGVPILSVDIPSGVNGETGATEGPTVPATATVAIAAQKIGTAVGPGAVAAGDVEVADIGITVPATRGGMPSAADVRAWLPGRAVDAHKRSHGSVALLVGAPGMSGAAILTARGALRAGAGFVTAGVTAAIDDVVSQASPETVTAVVTSDDHLGPQALTEFKSVLERSTALAIGPGIGQGSDQRALVAAVLSGVEIPVVLDADALNVLADDTGPLRDRAGPTVITPHPAELARLLHVGVDEIQADRVEKARTAARDLGCVVVLKGFRSIVSDGDRTIVNPTGNSALATAGTGDVLTGVVAAFLAAGLPPLRAAVVGPYVHGLAGELAGDAGVVAMDVAEALPEAMDLIR